jgi:hypothetical protein
MSMFDELEALLNRLPLWKQLVTLPARVRAIEERLNMVKGPMVDDRQLCRFCRIGKPYLIDTKPDPLFDEVGVKRETFKCDNPACGRETVKQHWP